MANIDVLDDLDLAGLQENGKPAPARLRDVDSAVNIYGQLKKADEASALNRARYDAMFDGAAPYDPVKLAASGQALKTNLNFGEAQRLLDIALSAYVDLASSLECLLEVKSHSTDPQREEYETIVAEEATHTLRGWPEFHSAYLRLCTTFIKHGVGIAYFDSPSDWRFNVTGLDDILIPRQSKASEECIDVAVARRKYSLDALYRFIKNEKAAKATGWNVAEVKRAMLQNARTSHNDKFTDYEALQAEIKNNDIYFGVQNPTVEVLHFYVKELDGKISHYIAAADQPKAFMYEKQRKYDRAEQAYIFFTYGVGSNGTYHSVRGLGHRIFAHIQTSNRLRCQHIDGAMLASSVMLQPENNRALEELSFTMFGPYTVMSPNVNIVEKAIPNLGTAVQPALQDISQQLQLNTDTISTYGAQQNSPYRNQTQVIADMDVATRLSGATLNLFYMSWTRLMREFFRRLVNTATQDPASKTFFKRCAERGVSAEFIKQLDFERTRAVRSIGNGSMANRLVALRELQGISGQFDDVGRRNLTRDIVATRVGHDLADRYVPSNPEAGTRQTVETKVAIMENAELAAGRPIPVLSNEMHGEHLQVHLPETQQLIEAYESGQMEPQQLLPAVQAFYQHLAETAQYAGADVNLQSLFGQTKQVMQYLEEIINNTQKALQAEQRQQMEAEGAAPQQVNEAMALKQQQAQLDMQIKQQKAELDLQIKQRKFDQEQALRDAKAALDFRESAQQSAPNQPLPERSPFAAVRVRNR